MTTKEHQEVSSRDYKNLEEVFRNILNETSSFTMGHPELADQLDDFIQQVGVSTKELLQKYGKADYIQKLEVEDYKNQMLTMKKTMVKMKLQVQQVTNACNGFTNASKS